MRDWVNAFRRASFRGVSFWVDSEGPERGRRVAVHEISGGNTPVVEDMGRRATSFSIYAYVASDRADYEGLALEAACDASGPSMLVLPMEPGQTVHCLSCRRDWTKDRMGYVAYDLAFVEAGSAGLSIGGLGALQDAFSTGLSAVASSLSGAL